MQPDRQGIRNSRRRWLKQAGALASSTAMPLWIPGASRAQSTLNALPRVGLVIGNTKYAEAPLKNPANDAKAIAGVLQQLGFQINLKLDAGKNEMLDAISAFGNELLKKKSVGLFYYAGHGVQLAWKNYLIPVDAVIDQIEDMQAKTVELNSLLQGLVRAQNPMNVIILDACRDNPFGNKARAQQKGLSQFDAPPGSLLAYATSPGNTAADGEGANGLYTENLLRELNVPEEKIEDVFKRVRLNVRRKSQGQQIPWESTSLEEDFYFRPPKQAKKLTDEELEKQFEEELAIWEKIKDSKEPGPLEDYLRKNPSGRFSEMAQFQLDRVLAKLGEKKILIEVSADNPFTKGTAFVDTHFKIGDSWSYRGIDLYTKLVTRNLKNVVTGITDNEVIFNNGALVTDLFGNPIKLPDGRQFSQAQFYIQEYSVGKKWTTRFRTTVAGGRSSDTELEFRVIAPPYRGKSRTSAALRIRQMRAMTLRTSSVLALPTYEATRSASSSSLAFQNSCESALSASGAKVWPYSNTPGVRLARSVLPRIYHLDPAVGKVRHAAGRDRGAGRNCNCRDLRVEVRNRASRAAALDAIRA